MSRQLSISLGAEEPEFSQQLSDWEAKAGRPSHDVRLATDITKSVQDSIRRSNLDVSDTTPEELYYALNHRIKEDNKVVAEKIGVKVDDSPHVAMQKIVDWVNDLNLSTELWVVKNSVVKSFLKQRPPKQLMKSLKYRSVDSILKRNDPSDLIAVASIVEHADWHNKLLAHYERLQPKDFHVSNANIHIIDPDKIKKLRENGLQTTRIITPCFETGVIVVLTPNNRFQNDVLTIIVTLIETLSEMRMRSAYFRLISTQPDFGKKIASVTSRGLHDTTKDIHGFHWNPVHKHLVGNEEFMFDLAQPHLVHSDLTIHSSSDVLSEKDQRFLFWKDLDHAIYISDELKPVSLHIADVSINASNDRDYENAEALYAKKRLHELLWSTYLQHPTINQQIISSYFGDDKL